MIYMHGEEKYHISEWLQLLRLASEPEPVVVGGRRLLLLLIFGSRGRSSTRIVTR